MKRASRLSAVLAVLVLVAPALGLLTIGPPAHAANPAYDPDSCANGGTGSTATTCTDGWINGNLTDGKAHYAEGDSVAYRSKFSNLTPGDWTVVIGYDVLQGGKHAIDYLTTYNRRRSLSGSQHVQPGGVDHPGHPQGLGRAGQPGARPLHAVRGGPQERQRLHAQRRRDHHCRHVHGRRDRWVTRSWPGAATSPAGPTGERATRRRPSRARRSTCGSRVSTVRAGTRTCSCPPTPSSSPPSSP